jgi:hypothetical protein
MQRTASAHSLADLKAARGFSSSIAVDLVARLEPVTGGKDEQDRRIARLVREGILRLGKAQMQPSLITAQPPRMKRGSSAVAVLTGERWDGR